MDEQKKSDAEKWVLPVLIVWVLLFVCILGVTLVFGYNNVVFCWDGMEIDETILIESCGITEEQYINDPNVLESCPEGDDAKKCWEVANLSDLRFLD
jgi:hypothetical protein